MPIMEFYFMVQASDVIGIWNTILIVLLTGVVGAFLAKSQGRQLILKIQQQTARGELPTDTMFQGLMVLVGGVLLVTPGFVTDAIGFMFVIPVTRWMFLGVLKSYFARQVKSGNFKVYTNVNINRQWDVPFDESNLRDVTPPKLDSDKN